MTELIRACSCGGGGALDHACHQRRSAIQGESQARTARSARGQDGAMNIRILTLDQLKAAQAKGDVTPFVDTHIYFDCSVVSSPVYMGGTPLNFLPGS